MGPVATWTLGILTGLVIVLATALTGVVAANGVSNPGPGSQASAAVGGTAEQQTRFREKEPGSLQALDLNGDGRLSLAEAAGNAEIVARFHRADRNKDGKLTQAEFDRLAKLPEPAPKAKRKASPKPRAQPQPPKT
jgi:hypothetical protein